MNDVLLPQLHTFSKAFATFKDDNKQIKQCVRAFDASLSTKANKTQIELLKADIDMNFMKNE